MRRRKLLQSSSGQSLIETALIVPLLLTIVLNAVNFAFFFLMALNITSASRTSAIYSVMGGSTPASIAYPKAGPMTTNSTVSYLAIQDLTGSVSSPSTNGGVQVCSSSVGILSAGAANMRTDCSSFGLSASYPTAVRDPETNKGGTAPAFLLNRVDVAYKFSPPIPLTPFNALLLLTSNCSSSAGSVTCTFYRYSVMREM
jgi:Flp pilus assembly protein TadG